METGLVVLDSRPFGAIGNPLAPQTENHLPGSLQASIEIDRAKHRFYGISEDGILPTAASAVLSRGKVQLGSDAC